MGTLVWSTSSLKENRDMIWLHCEDFVLVIDDNTVPKDGSKMIADIIERLTQWVYKAQGGSDKENRYHSNRGMSCVCARTC